MKKAAYLAEVAEFTTWMAAQLRDDSTLGHDYRRPRQAGPVVFRHLADALAQYHWPIAVAVSQGSDASGSLAANTLVLKRLQQALRTADTDAAARDAAVAVMQWGGVVNGNVRWLENNTDGLAALLRDVSDLLREDADDVRRFPRNLRFNAGMTKVYSLLLDNFIIYDSRVAAALCWFVLRWAIETGQPAIPPLLNFPCMPAKEGEDPEIRKVRNPSEGPWQFQRMGNRALEHVQWNLRASWLLQAVLAQAGPDTAFQRSAQPLRALEAALFMWGYDLGQNLPQPELPAAPGNENDIEDDEVDPPSADAAGAVGYTLHTLARNKAFHWYFDEQRDAIFMGSGATYKLPVNALFRYLHALYDEFRTDRMPLANNRDFARQIESAPDGMGKTWHQTIDNNLPVVSRLAAVLVAIGQLESNMKKKNLTFQFVGRPPTSIPALREQLSAYAR